MTIFAASTKAYWYLTRSTGVVALLLLTAIVVLGTVSPMRLAGSPRWPRFAVGKLHRDLSLVVLVLLAVHIVTSVLDSFAPIGLLDAVVPLHSSYRPLWLGFGALAFDLLVALTITSLIRRRLGYTAWRRIHWLAYASWPVAVLHSLGAGSDAKSTWLLWLTVACVAVALAAVVIRVQRAAEASAGTRAGWIGLALATPLGLAGFAIQGPLKSGWAARAGTPETILHPKKATTVAVVRRPAARPAVASSKPATPTQIGRFSAQLQGHLTSTPATGGTLIDIALSLHGTTPGVLRVRLAGQPLPGGGLSLVGSQVDLSSPALGRVLAGSVVSLNGQTFQARVHSNRLTYSLTANLNIDSTTGVVSGQLDATPVKS